MSTEERIKELEKRINVTLEYSESLTDKRPKRPDTAKLKKLAKEIRKNLEEPAFETTAYPHTS
jgi:hypothetical protein